MVPRPLYTDKIKRYIDTPFIKILTGVRRSGKSTILKMIVEELKLGGVSPDNILYYNFDSMQYEDIKTAKLLYDEIKKRINPEGRTYILLDEIQEVRSWEKAVNSIMTDFNTDIYVTGSNSAMLSSEISTYLTGRYITFRIFPLSFSEYLTFKKQYAPVRDVQNELPMYLRLGGFPAVHLQEYTPDEAYLIVRDIYNSVLFTDIVKRNQIRNIDQMERIVKYAFENTGRIFSAASVAAYLKNERRSMDNETVYSYLGKLENAFLLHRCFRYDIKGKEILKTQEKYYLGDPAFRYSTLGFTPDSIAAMLENLVYIELLRRGYEVYIGKLNGSEIDFVAILQERKLYIQITQRIDRAETELREYSRLLGIKDNFPKYVLRTDEFSGGNYQGIKTMHVADFLLSTEY